MFWYHPVMQSLFSHPERRIVLVMLNNEQFWSQARAEKMETRAPTLQAFSPWTASFGGTPTMLRLPLPAELVCRACWQYCTCHSLHDDFVHKYAPHIQSVRNESLICFCRYITAMSSMLSHLFHALRTGFVIVVHLAEAPGIWPQTLHLSWQHCSTVPTTRKLAVWCVHIMSQNPLWGLSDLSITP